MPIAKVMKKTLKNQGFSFLEILIGLSIAGVVGYTIMMQMSTSMRANKRIEMVQAKKLIVEFLQARVDCSLTENINTIANCTDGSVVTLKGRGGTDLVSANGGRKIGEWTLKATCSKPTSGPLEGTEGISVKVAWQKPGTNFNSYNENDYFQDPLVQNKEAKLKDKVMNYAHSQAGLFPNDSRICPDSVGAKTSYCEVNNACIDAKPILCISSGGVTGGGLFQFYAGNWYMGSTHCTLGIIVR